MLVDRLDFLRDCLFQATLDDYESLAILELELGLYAAEAGYSFEQGEIIDALQALTTEGAISAFLFAPEKNVFVSHAFDPKLRHEFWFLADRSRLKDA